MTFQADEIFVRSKEKYIYVKLIVFEWLKILSHSYAQVL